MSGAAASALIAFSVPAGCSDGSTGSKNRDSEIKPDVARAINGAMIARYCSYGAVSREQYDGCTDHVTGSKILDRSTAPNATNAALFGAGMMNECRRDSGPSCSEKRNLVETARLFRDQLDD